MGRLDNKVAIITGTGSGIGRAAAILFAKEGAKVVGVDWASKDGEETFRMIEEAGSESIFIHADVSKTEDIKNLIKAAVDTYGKLDVLYNNAGILGELATTQDCTEGNFDKIIAVNLRGSWLGMKYAIPEMLKAGGGSIISTASQAGRRCHPNLAPYNTSKGGVVSLTRGVAIEYATKNIRINCICPGAIATPLLLGFDPRLLKKLKATIPQGRYGEPEEVAQAALFLASDESSYITGCDLVIDAGESHALYLAD